MKLISSLYPSPWEVKHAYAPEEAADLVKQHFDSGQNIDGMDQLRSYLMLNFDSEVLKQVESGEWLPIKEEAYYFDWRQFDKNVSRQLLDHKVMELMYPRPVPEKKYGHVFRVTNSETGEPLRCRTFVAIVDGKRSLHATDIQGLARVSAPSAGSDIAIHVMFSAPTGELEDFLDLYHE